MDLCIASSINSSALNSNVNIFPFSPSASFTESVIIKTSQPAAAADRGPLARSG